LVTGGGLSLDGKSWVSISPEWQFPVKALSIVFRAKFRDGLRDLFEKGQLQFPISESGLSEPIGFARWLRHICRRKWVVYTKRPFAGPQAVLAYLCRYTHRVAITNSRFEALNLEGATVTFRYKDYAHESQIRSMTLCLKEFIRRFCLHILPPRFVKIRSYGLLSNRDRSTRIAQARKLLAQSPTLSEQQSPEEVLAIKQIEPPPLVCPYCGRPTLVLLRVVERPKRTPMLDTS
jgi:hypothetical protein